MATEIITREDLIEFGEGLVNQIKALITGGTADGQQPKYLKSYQVKNLLKIPFTKIGGILYYSFEDIQKVLRGEVHSKRIRIAK
jgi:hypothetical protein